MIVSNPCTADARVLKMAESVRDMGHDVHIFATLGKDNLPYEVVDGISFYRFNWNPGAILREIWYVKLLLKFIPFKKIQAAFIKELMKWKKYSLFEKIMLDSIIDLNPDLIHAHDLMCLPVGATAAEKIDAKLIYDAHELEVHRNPPLSFPLKKFVGGLERRCTKNAGAVIIPGVLSSEVLKEIIKRNHIDVVYNSPRINDSPSTIRGDLGISDETPLLLYVGKITMGRGVGSILKILDKLPGVFFAAVGPRDPTTYKALSAEAKKLGVANRFRMLPPVPYDQVVSYIRGANLGLLSVEPVTLSYQYCMPNKLFEMTLADIPILANDLDEVSMFIHELGNGKIVDFEKTASLPLEIFSAMNSSGKYKLSQEAISIIDEKYTWNAQDKKLRRIYGDLLQGQM